MVRTDEAEKREDARTSQLYNRSFVSVERGQFSPLVSRERGSEHARERRCLVKCVVLVNFALHRVHCFV